MRLFLQLFAMLALLAVFPTVSWAEKSVEDVYTLGAGDKLRVTVFGEEDLSGEFEVDGSGILALPLIGNVEAGNLTVRELESLAAENFRDGYLVSPKISIEVLNFRPFFIMGEVKNPGSYPYVNALTVLNAVALAGGYTPRAKEDNVIIHRKVGETINDIEAKEATRVFPGDTIRVKERFF